MDPGTAIGIAAAVLQFVDFGTDLLSETYRIYKSPSGIIAGEVALSTIVEDLNAELAQIQTAVLVDDAHRSPALNELLRISRECEQVVTPLREAIKRMQKDGVQEISHEKATVDGKRTLVKSFRTALEGIWNRKKVEETVRTLQDLSRRMTSATLFCLWYDAQPWPEVGPPKQKHSPWLQGRVKTESGARCSLRPAVRQND